MMTIPVHVSLQASDGSATTASGMLQEYSRIDRVRRATVVMVIAVAFAAMLIPIPIIHLLGIPLALIGGAALASRQLGIAFRLMPVRLACPRCEGVNRVGGGLGIRSVDEPIDRMCEHCRRELLLRIVAE